MKEATGWSHRTFILKCFKCLLLQVCIHNKIMEALDYLIIWKSRGPGSGWMLSECVLTLATPSYQPLHWAEPLPSPEPRKTKPQWVSRNVENIPQESIVPMALLTGGSQAGEDCSGIRPWLPRTPQWPMGNAGKRA